jgi:alpha-glucosidase (family GH31 glycosyl hydrolase)
VAEQTGDRRALEVYRRYSRLRMNLVPYLFDQGVLAAQTGLPIMRAMALAFPADANASRLDDQYMLGSELLVAPVLEPGATERRLYLPSGEWFDFWTGELIDDGWRTVPAPMDRIPVFARQGAVVPLWMPPDDVSLAALVGLPGDSDGRLVLMVTPGERAGVITEPVTRERWPVEIRRHSTSVTVTAGEAPDGTVVWLRGPRTDRRAEVTDGSVTVAIG